MTLPLLVAGWPLPVSVSGRVTTRVGGVSQRSWGGLHQTPDGLNLGARCGDDPAAVAENRRRLTMLLPTEPVWLEQVHGVDVHVSQAAALTQAVEPRADAAVTSEPGRVLAVQSADCLTVLFSDFQGRRIGAAHAGWRGLAAGVLENTVAALRGLPGDSDDVVAWLGPAIGPEAFEVGAEVLEAFLAHDPGAGDCFRRGASADKWMADLFGLARRRLASVGVEQVGGGGLCTFSDAGRFYSHRRDRTTGRLASLIWINPAR